MRSPQEQPFFAPDKVLSEIITCIFSQADGRPFLCALIRIIPVQQIMRDVNQFVREINRPRKPRGVPGGHYRSKRVSAMQPKPRVATESPHMEALDFA